MTTAKRLRPQSAIPHRPIWVIAPAHGGGNIGTDRQMAYDARQNGRPSVLRPLGGVGRRAAASALRPLSGAMEAAFLAGMSLERRAVDRVLDSAELERIVASAIDSEHVQVALRRVLESDGAKHLVDSLFDSGLIDRLIERLASSEALWQLIDTIAQSPTVTAAISQQGLGFADEVGDEVRQRSRHADDWLERTAQRMFHRHGKPHPPEAAPNAG